MPSKCVIHNVLHAKYTLLCNDATIYAFVVIVIIVVVICFVEQDREVFCVTPYYVCLRYVYININMNEFMALSK